MQYKIFTFGDPGQKPEPTNYHKKLEELQATIDLWAADGWTFPGAVVRKYYQGGIAPIERYYLGLPATSGISNNQVLDSVFGVLGYKP